jgi:TupA-like ATPgrasp
MDVLWALTCKLPSGPSRRALFFYAHGRFPRVRNPITFNEKVNWRIMKDRREILTWTCDKLALKDYASNVQVATGHDLRAPNTLWSGTDVKELESVVLPDRWVLKPNHRSGQVFFGHGRPEVVALQKTVRGWFRPAEAKKLHEWAYLKARPLLLAEEMLGVSGSPPSDYKFYVFEGEVAVIEVHADRYDDHRVRYYLPDWSPLEVGVGITPLAAVTAPPDNLEKMVEIAGELGRPFDFMRVDLYNVNGECFFGELSPYPGSGIEPFHPTSFDDELGAKWKLPVLLPGGDAT